MVEIVQTLFFLAWRMNSMEEHMINVCFGKGRGVGEVLGECGRRFEEV